MKQSATQIQVQIRSYQPGDEVGQVSIYNDATRMLPGFKPATTDEVLRRYRASNFDPRSKIYAFHDGKMVGYASLSNNGRVSVPWCHSDYVDAAVPLMNMVLDTIRERGATRAWAAYRPDWHAVHRQLESFGFRKSREILNFVSEISEISALPREATGPYTIERLNRDQVTEVYEIDPTAFEVSSANELAAVWMDGPYISGDSLFILRDEAGQAVGVALAIINSQYADPIKIDSAMPCFRLGAIRTELERTKRVNGLFSYVARPGAYNHELGRRLLSEACRLFAQAGLTHLAAQCPSDRHQELAFYRTHFQPQKSFPIYARDL